MNIFDSDLPFTLLTLKLRKGHRKTRRRFTSGFVGRVNRLESSDTKILSRESVPLPTTTSLFPLIWFIVGSTTQKFDGLLPIVCSGHFPQLNLVSGKSWLWEIYDVRVTLPFFRVIPYLVLLNKDESESHFSHRTIHSFDVSNTKRIKLSDLKMMGVNTLIGLFSKLLDRDSVTRGSIEVFVFVSVRSPIKVPSLGNSKSVVVGRDYLDTNLFSYFCVHFFEWYSCSQYLYYWVVGANVSSQTKYGRYLVNFR